MTPHKQLFRHKPDEGIYGDCTRTAIACLLDLHPSEVPHEHRKMEGLEASKLLNDWLAKRGLRTFAVAYDVAPEQVLKIMAAANPGTYWMMGGASRTGCNHTVVCRDDQIVWDPSQNDSGIIGPCDDGMVWVEVLVHQP